MGSHIRHLEIILKISERCNINCTYCYVFNKGNSAADDSPALISKESIESLVAFLRDAVMQFDIDTLQIDFHGGEPLMMKKKRFAWICEQLRDVVGPRLALSLQTNGILIDEEWIDLFRKYDVSASISIDGTKETNDRHRLDKQGQSTYDGTIRGLRMLQEAYKSGQIIEEPGILCVINPNANGAETYRHFVDDLKVNGFDFLIPDDTYEDNHVDNDGVGRYLISALDEWFKDGAPPEIQIPLFYTHIAQMLGASDIGILGQTPIVEGAYAFTMGSDGMIRIDDTLRSTSDPIFDPIGHVSNITLSDVIASPAMKEYEALGRSLPSMCHDCVWEYICGGGRILNRFSKEKRFANKTVYCTAMRKILSRTAAHLINMGMSEELLMSSLQARPGHA